MNLVPMQAFGGRGEGKEHPLHTHCACMSLIESPSLCLQGLPCNAQVDRTEVSASHEQYSTV